MKLIRFIIISALVLFGVLTAVFALFPSHVQVSRLISVNASKNRLDSLVCELRTWSTWNQFLADGALTGASLSTPSSGNGAVFTSDQATITIRSCFPDSVLTLWHQRNGRNFTGNMKFTSLNDEVVVEWDFDFYVKWYPWEKMSALFFDKQMGPVMENFAVTAQATGRKKLINHTTIIHSIMNKILLTFLVATIVAVGCNDKPVSPHETASGQNIQARYGRPYKKGRDIFGGLEKFGVVYRCGADSATILTFAKDAEFAGKPVKAGQYTLFVIPYPDQWTIILNSQLGQWGAFDYEKYKDKDLLHATVPTRTTASTIEQLTIRFPADSMIIEWDNTQVAIPVSFN